MNLTSVSFEGNLVGAPQLTKTQSTQTSVTQKAVTEMTSSAPPRLFTEAEAAARLGIIVADLAAYRTTAKGPDFVKLGRIIRYIEDDLDWWLEQPA